MLRQRRADLRRRFLCAAAFLVLSLLVGVTPAVCGDAPSNLDLMTEMTAAVANELGDKFASQLAGRGVKLRPYAADERYQFLNTVFISTFADRGMTVYKSSVPDSSALTVEFQALKFELAYPRVYRSWLFGGKKVERRADITILATIYDPTTGSVLWVGQGGRETVDEFEHGDVKRIQEGTFSFARPELPTSGWSKLVEPVFVGGIVVGLIYLFFSNQNSDTS